LAAKKTQSRQEIETVATGPLISFCRSFASGSAKDAVLFKKIDAFTADIDKRPFKSTWKMKV
jgi:hypothetical protein